MLRRFDFVVDFSFLFVIIFGCEFITGLSDIIYVKTIRKLKVLYVIEELFLIIFFFIVYVRFVSVFNGCNLDYFFRYLL